MGLKVIDGPHGSFDTKMSKKVEQIFSEENLLQSILHAHLLLEQALLNKIKKQLKRPEVFQNNNYSGFSFSQKITLYIALYDPEKNVENYMLAFNKMRNMIAHQLIEPEQAIEKCLRPLVEQSLKREKSNLKHRDNPKDLLIHVFGFLIFFELGAIHGLRNDHI